MIALLRAGYAVRAVTRHKTSFPDLVETTIVPDLKNCVDWKLILQGVDIIIHLAGIAHTEIPGDGYTEIERVNYLATQHLAIAAKEARVERFIYISSVRAQAGPFAVHVLREHDEPHPTDAYGRSKLAAEQAVRAAGVPFTIFRPVIIYGPNPKGNMRTLVRFAKLPIPLPFGSFTGRRSLLGIDNFISAVTFALHNPATVGETYLLADPTPMTIGEILAVLRRIQGRSLMTLYVPQIVIRFLLMISGRKELWSRFAGELVVDTSKLTSLGWHPPKDTSEGLIGMMDTDYDDSALVM